MADWLAGTLISIAMVPLAFGISHGKDIVRTLWATRQSKAKPISAVNVAWPCAVIPNETWLCKEVTPRYVAIDEAEEIFRSAWLAWGSERVEGEQR